NTPPPTEPASSSAPSSPGYENKRHGLGVTVQRPAGQRPGVEHADVLGGGGLERVAIQDLGGAATHLEIVLPGAVRSEGRGLDRDPGDADAGTDDRALRRRRHGEPLGLSG